MRRKGKGRLPPSSVHTCVWVCEVACERACMIVGEWYWLADGFVIVVDMLKKIVTEKYAKLHDVCRKPSSDVITRTHAHAARRLAIELPRLRAIHARHGTSRAAAAAESDGSKQLAAA